MSFLQYPYHEVYEPKHVYIFSIPCVICKQVNKVTLPAAGLFAYHQGKAVQFAFPTLSEGEREMLITTICPACWNTMFPPDEDECTCLPDHDPCDACQRRQRAKFGDEIPY